MKTLIFGVVISVFLVTGAQAGTVASKLYAVTGNGSPPETLFELDKSDASSTLVLTLGNGGDGEEIAYNPDDGLLYHASGSDTVGPIIFESIDLGTLTVTPIALSGDAYGEVSGLTYAGSNTFLASDQLHDIGLSSITSAGVTTNIGATDTSYNGLAFIGSTLYAVDRNNANLRTIDPANGSTLTSTAITLAGFTLTGGTGLATDPVDDSLWALLKYSGAPNPKVRLLVTIDPATAVATLVGQADVEGLAGLAFVSGTGHTVTSSVGMGNGTISPLGPTPVIAGFTADFTLTPDPGNVIESVGGTCGGSLNGNTYTTNVITADCTVIANFEPEPTTILYGVTGDGGVPAETLFRLSTSDASSTFVLTLGNGNDGEEIAFNRDDGLMYHASGATGMGADVIFESIDLTTLMVTDIPLSGFNYKEVVGLTYAGSGVFLAGDRTTSTGLSSITTAGVASNIGGTSATLMGLAFIGPTLYAVDKSDNLLRTINPSNGNTTSSVAMSLAGFTITGATGLAANPDDNTLWVLLKDDSPQPANRVLATVDPMTGVATLVGITDVPGLAGIAFAYIPCATCEVTPSVGTGPGTITPSTPQSVPSGNTTMFTLTPGVGYFSDFVDGTCGGTLVGDTFTTSTIYNNCTVVAHFAIQTFDLEYFAGTGGSISGDTSQTVDYGSNGTQVTAVPDTNWDFVDWSDGVLTASRTDTNVMADLSVTANFALEKRTVSSSVGTPSGTISPLGDQDIDYGTTTQFLLTPSPNYHIDSVGGTCGGNLVGNTYTINPITVNCTVIANFTIDTFTLTYTAGNGGSISGTTPQVVEFGANGTPVTAVPDPNHSFVGWSDGVMTPSRTDTNVMADLSVIANFAIDTYTVTSSVGAGLGSISPLGGQTIDHGDTPQFTVTPDTGYDIDFVGGTCGGNLVGNTYTTNPVTGNCTVVANFVIQTFTLEYTAGPNGSISGVSPQMVDYGMNGSEVTAVPDANYDFVDWSDGVLTAARTDTNVMADLDVTANFVLTTHTVSSSVGTPSGSITPLGVQEIDHNTTTLFTVTPDTGYHIESMGGSCGGNLVGDTYTTDPIVGDCTVVANFEINTYTLTYTAGSDGSISGTSPQMVDHGMNGSEVTAVPDANFVFVDWSDGVMTAARTDTNVMADINVTANFGPDTHTVSSSVGTPAGNITPLGAQEIEHNETTQFTLTPDPNYHIESVGGTCGGNLAGSTFTTDPITADCTVVANFEIDTHTVSSSVGTPEGSIAPLGDQEIEHGSTTQFTLTPDPEYRIESVGGTCGGSLVGNMFTTDPITGDCTVVANFEIDTHTVTSSVGTPAGTIAPLGAQEIEHNETTQFTLTPDPNYHIESVGGTCGGNLAGSTYTTDPIVGNCTVIANFEIDTHTVSSSVGTPEGSIAPLGAQEVDHGQTAQFELTPATGFEIDSVSGSCGGMLVGMIFTTDPVVADCTVVANFVIQTFTLTYTASPGGSISGTTPQEVDFGQDGEEVTAVPDANFNFVDWSDGVMTAARTDTNVMADISVTANFAIDTYTVTSSVGAGDGDITPLGDQQIDHGATAQFILIPGAGHTIDSVDGTCGGSLVGDTYTTDPITSACTVIANFTLDPDVIQVDGFESP